MEAVPKLPLISFDLKVSPENTHFGPKLKQYISEAYREDPDSYGNEMHQLEGLRSAAVRASIDAAGVSALVRYFCQLRALQSRFPMAKGQPAACSFTWKDLYANMSCTLPDIRFEMACVLFNVGALHTQLGASQPRTTPESLKAACQHYQNAAWVFQLLREQYPQPPGADVSTEILRLLQEVCFAQAQECILDKSIQDTRKPSVIGAVATQVLYFYKNSLAYLGPSTGTDNIHEIIGTKLYNYWHRYLSFKAAYIGCIVCLYQGIHAEEQQNMGERVAFYQQAIEKLGEARKLAKYIEPVQITQEALTFTNDVVEGKRKAAKNENEFIYHEEVPDKDQLTDLKPVCLVKAMPINFNDPEISGPDIFSRLVPIGAHEASSMYSEEKAKLLRHVVSQAEAKNTELMEFMSSLQLDQLELLDSDQTIPQEIVDRCAAMNAKTEIIQTLVDSMNSLAEIISDVEHSLTEIKTMIQEETLKEKEYQKIMGPRPPSIVQTEISREFHKYQEAHARTNESNQVLHKAMTLHIANLRLLAQPLDVLQNKIPSINNIEGLDRETMKEMRRVVGKAREMRAQREALVAQLRDAAAADDITQQLLARSTEPADEIFKQEIEKHTPKVKIIEQNLAAQENIINKLTTLYAAYGESRRLLSDVIRKRDGLINALVTSYDTHTELLGKSQKGLEFYRKLAHNVSQLLARLRSTCQVQREERAQLMANQRAPTPTPTPSLPASSTVSKALDAVPTPSSGGTLKLKDYLPYMKNRNMPRSVTPQAQIDPVISDAYYPESIYPTSVRPTPVGSEATDLNPMNMQDGVMPPNMQTPNPYARYATPYAPTETIQSNYAYPTSTKGFDKPIPDDVQNYAYTSYTPPQYSSQMVDPQTYTNPYYTATADNTTIVTDSQNLSMYTNVSQPNMNPNANYAYSDQYAQNQVPNQTAQIPDPYSATSQADLNASFAQMQVSVPKSEPPVNYGGEYSQTYYSVQQQQYPNVSEANMSYSNATHGSNTTLVPSQLPSDYSNYSYSNEAMAQYGMQPVTNAYSVPNQYSYTNAYDSVSQSYTYTHADSTVSSTSNATVPAMSVSQTYSVPSDVDTSYMNPSLAQIDALDQPIKSHVTGQALSTMSMQPSYVSNQSYNPSLNYTPDQNVPPTSTQYSAPSNVQNVQNTPQYSDNSSMQSFQQQSNQYPQQIQNVPQQNNTPFQDQSNANYTATYQNHPGYTFNNATGTYEYNYGSQNSYTNFGNVSQGSVESPADKNPNWATPGVYTSAGTCETVQSPSDPPESQGTQSGNDQIYYNLPYGYQTALNQASEGIPQSTPTSTNYGANMNQSTYMQSGQGKDMALTYTNNQVESFPVTTPKENTTNQSENHTNVDQSSVTEVQTPSQPKQEVVEDKSDVKKAEANAEPSAFDLLSDIDFTVEHKPLMPEIKVPQVSEKTIVKAPVISRVETPTPVVKEEVIERPAKRDIFSDPSLLNQFTQEVKNLQKLTESLTNPTSSGITLLDAKWKNLQDVQSKENMKRTKNVAMQYTPGNIVTAVVPYDDSRLTLKSDPDAYINASYYKQLAPWCIPLVISKPPEDEEAGLFWRAILENKISCVVCLLSEIEMQGKSYWPTAKGQALQWGTLRVALADAACTAHWTERRLTLSCGATVLQVTHYQINVFPAKIVCSPLVMLAERVLGATYGGRLSNQLRGACVQCGAGAGRSAVLALLLLAMCQVRAGHLDLCDMLDNGCINLYKHRTNVLEDTKYLVDAYRTVLFYAQGVLISGTTMFNGEAISGPSGAAVLPPVTPTPSTPTITGQKNKFSKESFEEMKQSPGLKSGDMKDPLNFLDPLWSLKKK
ncbi:uncharacterized protein mop [Epargyreus clarus]|uniref:uncharacterized protein mop n=1 Tax=Epargyreus clarus TaxID=520877 RepID=UPI003C3014B3